LHATAIGLVEEREGCPGRYPAGLAIKRKMNLPRLRHDAFVFDSDAEFVDRTATFLEQGLAAGAATVTVTTRSNWANLRDELGPHSKQVSFVDRDELYVRPESAIAGYDAILRHHLGAGAPSVRVVGEVQFGCTPREWEEWTAYEAILNRAFADRPAWIVCPYDARELPVRVVEDASRTHPHVLTDEREPTSRFEDPEHVVRGGAIKPDPLPQLRALPAGGDPEALRERLATELAGAGLPQPTALNLLVAANEVAANAWQHAGGPTSVRAGLVDGRFVYEISDAGRGLDDPLAGYVPPTPGKDGNAGLWIARQLTSRLELLSSAQGLTVRLWA
jgi:anti-sigma regulatory factor (Ser/Thr protein kinase)